MGVSHFSFRNPRALGTVVDATLGLSNRATAGTAENTAEDTAERAADVLFAEIDRLEAVFSVFNPHSELCRWREGTLDRPTSDEFRYLMGESLRWLELTGGLFDPVATVGGPCYQIVDGEPVAIGDCSNLNLNAIAKGFIVERAVELVSAEFEVVEILVNAGGDVHHRGPKSIQVGIEDPALPFDNSPPLTVIEIRNEAVATSGVSRRGNHLIDPRTGQPETGAAAVTVVAASPMVADVTATALSIPSTAEALTLAERLSDTVHLAVLIIDEEYEQHCSASWLERFGYSDSNRNRAADGAI